MMIGNYKFLDKKWERSSATDGRDLNSHLQLVAKNCAATLRVLDIEWSTKVFLEHNLSLQC